MLAASSVHYTTAVNTVCAPEDGRNDRLKHVELIGIINKPLLLHRVGCLYYWHSFCTVNLKRHIVWFPPNKTTLFYLEKLIFQNKICFFSNRLISQARGENSPFLMWNRDGIVWAEQRVLRCWSRWYLYLPLRFRRFYK